MAHKYDFSIQYTPKINGCILTFLNSWGQEYPMFYPNVTTKDGFSSSLCPTDHGPEGICARPQLDEQLEITPFPDANRCSIYGLYGLLVKIYPTKTLLIPIQSAFRLPNQWFQEWGGLPKEDQMSLLFQGPTCFFFGAWLCGTPASLIYDESHLRILH